MKKITIIVILISTFFSSCINVKYSDKKTGKNLYEEFYIDRGINQYFIKPLKFDYESYTFLADFTFRDSTSADGYITCNFSICIDSITVVYDSIGFFTEKCSYKFINPVKMYIDTDKNLYIRRYTSYLKYSEMLEFFNSGNLSIYVSSKSSLKKFLPAKKTIKNINLLNNTLFKLVELNKM